MSRARIKPSKASSLAGVIGGILFISLMVTVFLPFAQSFGGSGDNNLPSELGGPGRSPFSFFNGPAVFIVFMILAAGMGVLFSAYNLFSSRGVGLYDVDLDNTPASSVMDVDPANAPRRQAASPRSEAGHGSDFDARLRRLNKLKEDGLISDEEFQAKRDEIMRERW